MTGRAGSGPLRVLYVPMLSYPGPPYPRTAASAEVGFGRTSSDALVAALRARGVQVGVVPADPTYPAGGPIEASVWRARAYEAVLRAAAEAQPDVILVFHLFSQFASEIRRGLYDTGMAIPVAGFLHGSHWDFTDRFRQDHYPGLDLAELGNMTALDRIYCPSSYMRSQVIAAVSNANPALGQALLERCRVVGIPYPADELRLATRAPRRGGHRARIVYNHALIPSKRPDTFVEFARLLGKRRPAGFEVVVTRGPQDAWGERLVARLDPAVVTVAETLSREDYYATLWSSDIQVSTASHEGLGVATLEAMAAGCCCVVPAVGAYPELMAGTPEVLYDGSAAALVEQVEALLDDPARRAGITRRQVAHVARWSPDGIAEQLAADLAEVARVGHHPLRIGQWLTGVQ